MQPRDVVIVSACRTAIGKFQGQFKDVSARELAITAGKNAVRLLPPLVISKEEMDEALSVMAKVF